MEGHFQAQVIDGRSLSNSGHGWKVTFKLRPWMEGHVLNRSYMEGPFQTEGIDGGPLLHT